MKFQGWMGKKIDDLIPVLSKITRPVAAMKSLRFALFVKRSITEVGLANIGYQLNVSAVEQMATNLFLSGL